MVERVRTHDLARQHELNNEFSVGTLCARWELHCKTNSVYTHSVRWQRFSSSRPVPQTKTYTWGVRVAKTRIVPHGAVHTKAKGPLCRRRLRQWNSIHMWCLTRRSAPRGCWCCGGCEPPQEGSAAHAALPSSARRCSSSLLFKRFSAPGWIPAAFSLLNTLAKSCQKK